MQKQRVLLRSPPADRRRPLLEDYDYSSRGGFRKGHPHRPGKSSSSSSSSSSSPGSRRARVAELAGGTTAECAAVACCCPCGLVNLLVLAAFKVPAGLCRKALRRRRRGKAAKEGFVPPRKCCCCDDYEMEIRPITSPLAMVDALESDNSQVIELEKEMWDTFYGTGFWRSPSQRTDISGHSNN